MEYIETIKDTEKVLEKAIKRNGSLVQKMVWCEELSELIKAITKESRYGCTDKAWADIVEEISDVLICITEMMIYYKIKESTIFPSMNMKLSRTLDRLSSDNENNCSNTDNQ